MKKYILLCLLACFSLNVHAKKKVDKETLQWRYEVEDIGKVGKQGTAIFKIWTYAQKSDVAVTQAPKNAVHALIFKGYGIHKPLADNEAAINHPFFKKFFETGGEYQRFVSLANNGAVAPGDKIKLKKEYKVGVVVIVRKDELRKHLEQAGIIKPLNSIF